MMNCNLSEKININKLNQGAESVMKSEKIETNIQVLKRHRYLDWRVQ